jgi:hypothetical protein
MTGILLYECDVRAHCRYVYDERIYKQTHTFNLFHAHVIKCMCRGMQTTRQRKAAGAETTRTHTLLYSRAVK